MKSKKPRLALREIRLLSYLANGDTYQEIRSLMCMTSANVYTTCSHIRAKTGIQETRDQSECSAYLAKLTREDPQRVADAIDGRKHVVRDLTENQLDVLRLIALGRSYAHIAALLGIRSQSAQNLASRACLRAGITHQGWNRTKFIKEWLRRNDPNLPASLTPLPPLPRDPMDDPMF